jgi:DNA invertase Pin-like site-specific DNA recombinase
MRVALYLRTSHAERNVHNQRLELLAVAKGRGWTVTKQYVDEGISGAKGRDKRPGLDKALQGATRREYDILAVWSVDRLGRSLADLIASLNTLHAVGVDLYMHKQAIDTTTPAGRMIFSVLGAFAEFERAMIQARIKAGISRRRAAGLPVGGHIKWTATQRADLIAARAAGNSWADISRRHNIPVRTCRNIVQG